MQDKYVKIILEEAKKAYKTGEIPVGAIIVNNDKILSKAHNNRQKKYNVLGHAEINSIIRAERKIKDWRLDNSIMYVTMEPCKMCEMFIKEVRLSNVYYLVKNINNMSCSFTELSGYDREKLEYEELLKNFFKNLRK